MLPCAAWWAALLRKQRHLLRHSQQAIFKPVGIPLESLERIILRHEELEALRLADLEGQHQAEAAQQMGISRFTFRRLVVEVRRKNALALVNGLAADFDNDQIGHRPINGANVGTGQNRNEKSGCTSGNLTTAGILSDTCHHYRVTNSTRASSAFVLCCSRSIG